jgi:hypothetical protein
VNGVWSTLDTTFDPVDLQGDALHDLYATSSDGNLMHYDGASWTQVATNISGPVIVTPTRVYYTGIGVGLSAYSRATGTSSAVTPPPGLRSLVGAGGEELFALAQGGFRGSPLYHFDGTAWTPVRIPIGTNEGQLYSLIRVGRDVVLQVLESGNYHYLWLQRTGAW